MSYPTEGQLVFVARSDGQVRWELRAKNRKVLGRGPWRFDNRAALDNWNRARAIVTGFEYSITYEKEEK